jgi:hypothetical protein
LFQIMYVESRSDYPLKSGNLHIHRAEYVIFQFCSTAGMSITVKPFRKFHVIKPLKLVFFSNH